VPELNREQMEARRLEAERLLRTGVTQADVADLMRVSTMTVSRWSRRMARPDGMKATKAPGRPPLVARPTIRQIVARKPEWTARELVEAVADETGVSYDVDHGTRLLHQARRAHA
jgi:transposase